jgi:hypothetical protein
MQQTEALRTFSSACERLLFSIKTNRQLTEEEAGMVEHYCKEILAAISPRLPNRPPL